MKHISCATLTRNWLVPFSEWLGSHNCLEIMAGGGLLATYLRNFGVSVKATDDYTVDLDLRIDVEKLDCLEAIERYGKDMDYIICAWPTNMSDIAYKALLKMREVNPNCKMIYIGELEGGLTATSSFFKEAVYVEDAAFKKAVRNYTSWAVTADKVYLVK